MSALVEVLALFGAIVGAGFVYFLLLAAPAYLLYFVWKKDWFNPGFEPDWPTQLDGVWWTLISVTGNAALMLPFHVLVMQGYSQIYWSIDDYGWGWLAVSIVLYLAFTETCIYWIHRGLHTKAAFKYLHLRHHKWREPTPWMALSFHPLDSFAQALPHHLCVFLFPVHAGVYVAMVAFVTVWAVAIHDRVSVARHWAINYTGHHTIHHFYNRYNYGQFTTFWDRIGGTYKAPTEERFLRPWSEPTP